MTTIRDVARLAGVAPITVSRVINNNDYASKETRLRVIQAIEELGYVPNSLSQSFRWKQTGLFALLVTDITNPFWTTVARGVEDGVSDAGFNVILCNTDESDEEVERYLRVLLAKQIDGVFIVPASNASEQVSALKKKGIPAVVLDRRFPELLIDSVRCDSEQGAYLVTKHLLSLGHERISLINGPSGLSTVEDRTSGYLRAHAETHILPAAELIFNGHFTVESGEELAAKALASPTQPTALFAANNFLTLGCLKAIRSKGLQIPQDISLVGFDDLPFMQLIEPGITVATQPAYEMGRLAVELLLSRLNKKLPDNPQEIVLPTGLIIRQSCGIPPLRNRTTQIKNEEIL